MAKKVIKIPATLNMYTAAPADTKKKRRTVGYARVSTDMEEQQSSYEAQLDYYKKYIERNEDLEFAGMYSDDGISGTSIKRRDGFNRMIEDALAGKFELILIKSISRFARNTVDSLSTIRKLKEAGVEVYFEKEDIWTFDAKGEIMITIMSSLAQEESRSISENVTWGKRKSYADGKVVLPYTNFLGFKKDENGNVVIDQEEANTVRLIYQMFLEGVTCYSIGRKLMELGVATPCGNMRWHTSSVRSILTNEKYKGDAILQKTFTVDFLTKKHKKNEGEVPQYYVEGNHEAIIPPEVFDMVQAEFKRRTEAFDRKHFSGLTCFSAKVKCGQCGNWYGSKVWHSTSKYRRIIYRCNHKYDDQTVCTTRHVNEAELKDAFIKAYNIFLTDKHNILANVKLIAETLADCSELTNKRDEVAFRLKSLEKRSHDMISQNATEAQNQAEYSERFTKLEEDFLAAKSEYDKICEEISRKNCQKLVLENLIVDLQSAEMPISEFDEQLWNAFVEFVTVLKDGSLKFTFKDGTEI